MKHIMKYQLLSLLRNRALLFWTLLFPIIMMVLYSLTIVNLQYEQQVETIPVAIVDSKTWQEDPQLQAIMKDTKQDDVPLFNIQTLSQKEANDVLMKGEVDAVVTYGNEIHVAFLEYGVSVHIVESFFNTYAQQNIVYQTLSKEEGVHAQSQSPTNYIQTNADENVDISIVSFYSLIAMSALFGSQLIIRSLNDVIANQSVRGARTAIAPLNKKKLLLSSFLVTYLLQLVILSLQMLFLNIVIDVSFGDYWLYVIGLLIVAAAAGNGLGIAVSVGVPFKSFDMKINIVIAISLFCSFLSGMMSTQMKWVIQEYVPILSWINPTALITDALYALYYYGAATRFILNFVALICFTIVCLIFGYVRLRRQKYHALEVQV